MNMNMFLRTWFRRVVPGPIRRLRGRLAQLDLIESNLLISPPSPTRRLLLSTAQNVLGYSTFIETGTDAGDTTHHAAGIFEAVHSIELDQELARKAQKRFGSNNRITIHQGDSAEVLRELLPTISSSCLFWLDAHYSGGATARGECDTAIEDELSVIADLAPRPCAVLIDDVQMFGSDPAYPTLEATIAALRKIDTSFVIGVTVNMLWAAPKRLVEFRWAVTPEGVVEIAR